VKVWLPSLPSPPTHRRDRAAVVHGAAVVSGSRPTVIVLVAGTGTEVGKTWISACLLESWRLSGLTVAARKPAQSFTPGEGPTDADVLGAASGQDPHDVCPAARWYPVPLAPPMAAAALGSPVPTVAELMSELAWPDPGPDIGLLETAGGVRSPQADDGDVTDIVRSISPDHVVLVADAGLGTINAVRLSLAALTDPGLEPGQPEPGPSPIVILNRFDPSSDLHRRNLAWLRDRDAITVIAVADSLPSDVDSLADRLAPTRPARPARPASPASS
jgi:dethiobiotin synthetase